MKYVDLVMSLLYLGLAIYLIFFMPETEVITPQQKIILAAVFSVYSIYRLYRWNSRYN